MTKKLTLQEAAEFLRCSPKTLYNFTSARKIPHSKPMGRLLFDEKELEDWMRGFRVEVKNPTAVVQKIKDQQP